MHKNDLSLKRRFSSLTSSYSDRFSKLINKRPGTRILLYHSVGSRLKHDTYGISISARSFEEQVRTIAGDKSVRLVPLTSLMNLSEWKQCNTCSIAVTFDDGYKDNLYAAAPILIDYRVPFTLFVTVGFLGEASSVFLSKNELKRLSGMAGVTVGSHGMTHSRLTRMDDKSLRSELMQSRARIEDIIGKKVEMLSYPFGKVDHRVVSAAIETGYRLGAGSRFGNNFNDTNRMVLKRTEIWRDDSKKVFCQKYKGSWDWYGYYQRLRGL